MSKQLLHYHRNKIKIAETRRLLAIAKKQEGYIKPIRNTRADGLLTRRQGGFAIGISQHRLTNIISRSNRFDCPETLTKEGRVMYKLADLEAWKEKNIDLFDGGYLLESNEWTMPPRVMMLIEWLHKTKHVSKYAAELRVKRNRKVIA
jgi:hypothetical protein